MKANLLRAAAGIVALVTACAHAQSVVFLNPGKPDEVSWSSASRAMQAAARSLGMTLEVRYALRDRTRLLDEARALAARPLPQRPQYAVITDDGGSGPELLRILDPSGIRIFMAYSAIPQSDRASTGGPRAFLGNWIGSLEPHAEDAGYLTGKALIAAARRSRGTASDGKVHVIALGGDRATPSSTRLNLGMQRAITEAGDAALDQLVFASWSREKSREQAEWLFKRYPDARAIWAANDLMAFGAMDAWMNRGGKPGRGVWFTGINTSKEALAALAQGELAALAGGHFITGAWAMVMIYDYAHGRDFVDEGLELDRPMFTLFDAKSAERFAALDREDFATIDFRRYSKALNPKLARYDFDFVQLLR